MLQLKCITKTAIPDALEKALRYRLLNEPLETESICRDVLAVDPQNHAALVTLLLALTDQFPTEFTRALEESKKVLGQLSGDYDRAYYEGIIHERWANAQLSRNMPQAFALGWYREAMRCYEQAEKLSTPDAPDAVLRWNTCVRFLQQHQQVESQPDEVRDIENEFTDDVPIFTRPSPTRP